jgi:quercetin dioxygenase-like cupin family protein
MATRAGVTASYVENPVTRERFAFQQTEEDAVRLDWFLPPGGSSPEHVHPHQVERVSGIEGELEIVVRAGNVMRIGRGDVVEIPARTPHLFRNERDQVAHMTVEFLPALDMREFLEMAAGLARDGKVDKVGRPKNLLQLAAFVVGFRHVFHVTRPPFWVQRLTLTPLAALGRLFGYTRYDEKYRLPVPSASRSHG